MPKAALVLGLLRVLGLPHGYPTDDLDGVTLAKGENAAPAAGRYSGAPVISHTA